MRPLDDIGYMLGQIADHSLEIGKADELIVVQFFLKPCHQVEAVFVFKENGEKVIVISF